MKKGKELRETLYLNAPVLQEAEGKRRWTADVWKLDEINANGRIYSTALAQRICAEAKKTLARDGHDSDWKKGEEYEGTKAICGNPRIEDRKLVVDIDFIDEEYEKMLATIASKGVPIGVSSVGWGEVDESGLVIPETYEMVRFLDFVTCPAGDVYANFKTEGSQKDSESMDEGSPALAEMMSLARKIIR